MKKTVIGSIPNEIHYFYPDKKTKCSIGCKWDIAWDKDDSITEKVYEAFPCGDLKNKETAENWCKGYPGNNNHHSKVIQYSRANSPISNLRLFSLETRSKGGRAYKVLHKAENGEEYLFDMREDVLMDALLNEGVVQGYLKSKFIWARLNSQMRLIRIGSTLHDYLIAATERKDSKIQKEDLIPGQCYLNKAGKIGLFLGYFNSIGFELKEKDKWTYNYGKRESIWPVKDNFEIKKIEHNNALLFVEIWDHEKDPFKFAKNRDNLMYYSKLLKTNSYVQKVDHQPLIQEQIQVIVDKIKDASNKELEKGLKSIKSKKGLRDYVQSEIDKSVFANMTESGTMPVVNKELEDLLQ